MKPRFPLRQPLLAAAALLALSGPALRAQDFEGLFTARVKGMPGGAEMKTFLKGGKYRMEISMPQGSMAIIADPAAGETYMVMPAQQMVMVMKMPEAERMVDSLVRRNTTGEPTLTATGKKETVAGHACEYYQIKDERSTMDACMATDLGIFRGAASMFGGPPGRSGMAQSPDWAKELLRKGAFPLKVVDASGAVVWEVTSVEKKALEASLFTPPANFQRMQMPSFGRPPQG